MIDPFSALTGFRFGYKGAKAFMGWLDGVKEGRADLEKLKEVLKALAEDNERLIETTQQQQQQIDLLKRQVVAAFVLLTVALAAIVWLAIRH